ncbi:MAG: phosphohydrolase [Deltaproteobacteria bacterium]|nr:MAG: phosphohydrolase [Deltaproteobacteria bacterium]RLB79843.1 MAG: phosphohydrolase [Deltaproteobacteria bacterium]
MKRIVEFLFEIGMLKKTPRTGYQFLGSGKESVAAHSFRTAVIAYVLACKNPKLDMRKVVLMSLFHDFHEARTGDHNYVNKKYVVVDEEKAIKDQVDSLPFSKEILDLSREFSEGRTPEALAARDADQLDLIFELKEHLDVGNTYAKDWLVFALKRLHTADAKKMAEEVMATDWTSWWFDKKTDWWVNGPEGTKNSG